MEEEITSTGNLIAKHFDYLIAGELSKVINKPTKYKGIGRPRNTDYAILEHPFDKKHTKVINK